MKRRKNRVHAFHGKYAPSNIEEGLSEKNGQPL